ncbi:MAG: AmmeMemoRadiSam system protein B [Candidatus Binatia bacterium]
MATDEIHPPNLAGSWYPADAGELRAEIEALVGTPTDDPELRAIVVPHAGYRYSGKAAGAAYARLSRGRFRRAVVIAPSHYHSFDGAAVFPGSGFETPLGTIAVDRDAVHQLAGAKFFHSTSAPYAREHALEIQLPFLQTIDPDIRLVPVLVGAAFESAALAGLAPALSSLDDGDTLFVVSSDFTHYGSAFDYLPFPADDCRRVSERLRELDFGAIEPIRRGDVEHFARYVQETGITVCGRGPIAAFLHANRGRLEGEVVAYYTSLDVTGDCEHSVSYAAIVFRTAADLAA